MRRALLIVCLPLAVFALLGAFIAFWQSDTGLADKTHTGAPVATGTASADMPAEAAVEPTLLSMNATEEARD